MEIIKPFLNILEYLPQRAPSYDVEHHFEGISRKKIQGNRFIYYYIKSGKPITKKDLQRINSLKIPPNWENIWISMNPRSTIQVVGEDTKGRKQYLYHRKHIETAEKEKFLRLYKFIKAIPILNNKMKMHETLSPYEKKRVIVTIIQIIQALYLRVGKEKYARENRSYGVTSLKKKHLHIVSPNEVKFRFKAKSHQRVSYTLTNKKIIQHLMQLKKLEGEKLFQYVNENGKIMHVNDVDLNEYIQRYMGKEFTAKDFRTYAANFQFVKALLNETKKRKPKNEKRIKKNILEARKTTARYLRHTLSISKKSYIINFAMELYQLKPDYFMQNKDADPTVILTDILEKYKKHIKM
jgi:DNA topoisomerase I